jgi:hypothetical protein
MRLEIASTKAIKYACINFHYAKAVPGNSFGYSVFNDENHFCGVVLFGHGANQNIGSEFNLNRGQVIELTRVALNGKQGKTSKAVAIAIRLLKKNNPTIKLIVSYADKGQNHTGIIYQALNWFYMNDIKSSGLEVYANGKWMHKRSYDSLKVKPMIVTKRYKPGKHKYIYPLENGLIDMCKKLSKPYPKNAAVAHKGECQATSQEGAFDSTSPL